MQAILLCSASKHSAVKINKKEGSTAQISDKTPARGDIVFLSLYKSLIGALTMAQFVVVVCPSYDRHIETSTCYKVKE